MNAYNNEIYQSVEGTLKANATNLEISMGQLKSAVACSITNDDSSNNFVIQINGKNSDTSPHITIKSGETLQIENVVIRNLYLTNRSGSPIAYRIIMWGSD